MAINQTISTIPQAGHRGIDTRDTFVTKQEAFQDALTDVFVTEINTFKTQANALETNVNTKEATVVAKEALMSPHYSAIDAINSNMSDVNTVADNITKVDTVHTNIAKINTTADNIVKVGTVADNIVKVGTVADNITDIQNAEENALLAITAKNDAELAYSNAIQAANVSKWVSGTSYLEGDNVWSIIDFQTYRAKANTSGTTDPSLDSINWASLGGLLVSTTSQAQSGTDDTTAITPLKLREGLMATGTAPIYACRAWGVVTVTGGTPTLSASGNISSISDGGVGMFTVNMTKAMPDTNYAIAGSSASATYGSSNVQSSSSFTFYTRNTAGTLTDPPHFSFSVFK